MTRDAIDQYQLRKLRETIKLTAVHSPFYRSLLKGFTAQDITCLRDLGRLPFTTAGDIRENPLRLLCISQDDISRVVTLDSSGTTGKPKRIYFTAADQELTIDFFKEGMSTVVVAGDRVLILLPGERTGSVGDLLAKALNRLGATAIPHGVVKNVSETLKLMLKENVTTLVGIPTQVLALARYSQKINVQPVHLKSVLLSTDYVPNVLAQELEQVWYCKVFEHYGMTEMGLGGGVDCEAHSGYHLREADLYVEIIDPITGCLVPENEEGEVVFTTLTRQGMPLIRYRTGDISRFLSAPCQCKTVLRRLDYIKGRNMWRTKQFTRSGMARFNWQMINDDILASLIYR